jgi:hypothetical protein
MIRSYPTVTDKIDKDKKDTNILKQKNIQEKSYKNKFKTFNCCMESSKLSRISDSSDNRINRSSRNLQKLITPSENNIYKNIKEKT